MEADRRSLAIAMMLSWQQYELGVTVWVVLLVYELGASLACLIFYEDTVLG